MKSNILDGKLVAKSIETNVRNRVLEYEENYNDNITLATIIIGNICLCFKLDNIFAVYSVVFCGFTRGRGSQPG